MNPNESPISQIFNVWRAAASQDERGGHVKTVGYYTNTHDASSDAKGQGFWGSDGTVDREPTRVVKVKVDGKEMIFPLNAAVTVFTEDRATREKKAAEIREQALRKLTPAEREILGV